MNLWVMKFIQSLISYTRSQRAYYLSPAEKFECIDYSHVVHFKLVNTVFVIRMTS